MNKPFLHSHLSSWDRNQGANIQLLYPHPSGDTKEKDRKARMMAHTPRGLSDSGKLGRASCQTSMLQAYWMKEVDVIAKTRGIRLPNTATLIRFKPLQRSQHLLRKPVALHTHISVPHKCPQVLLICACIFLYALTAQWHCINWGGNALLLIWKPMSINFFSTVMQTLEMILLKQAHQPETVLLVSTLIREQKYTITQGLNKQQ